MGSRPNVLFILSDQHNAKVLGHRGHPDVVTPNLDRLAAEGIRVTNTVTQNPICTPSRVSWLSGQYCHNHGYYGLGGPNELVAEDAAETTMHEVELTGLAVGAAYQYAVSSDSAASSTATFTTAPLTDQPFRFAAYGDSRSGRERTRH